MKNFYLLIILILAACQTIEPVPYKGVIIPLDQPIKITIKEIPKSSVSQLLHRVDVESSSPRQQVTEVYRGYTSIVRRGDQFISELRTDQLTINATEQEYDVTITHTLREDGSTTSESWFDNIKNAAINHEAGKEFYQKMTKEYSGDSGLNDPGELYPFPADGFEPNFKRRVSRIVKFHEIRADFVLKGKTEFKGRPSLYFELSGSGKSASKYRGGEFTYDVSGYHILDIETGSIAKSEEFIRYRVVNSSIYHHYLERIENDTKSW